MRGRTVIAWPLAAAALFGFSVILLDALDNHLFKPMLSAEDQARFLTALDMHRTHALALLAIGLHAQGADRPGARWLRRSALCFVIGILCFSGSLYLHVLLGRPVPLAPFGGVMLMLGWLCLLPPARRRPGD